MSIEQHTSPKNLLRYAFWWNELRLVIAAISLLWGTTPIAVRFLPSGSQGVYTIATFISGLAGAYLLYIWFIRGRKLFGKNDTVDLFAFMVATLSGIHLGIGTLIGSNIIMSLLGYSGILFTIAVYAGGLLYLWSAWYLYVKFKAHNNSLF